MYTLKEINTIEEFETYFQLKSQPNAIYWSGFNSAPNYDKLKEYFFNTFVKGGNDILYYLIDDSIPTGYIQIRKINHSFKRVDERGFSIFPKYQGLGLTLTIHDLLFEKAKAMGVNTIEGWVSGHNKVSNLTLKLSKFTKTEEKDIRKIMNQ